MDREAAGETRAITALLGEARRVTSTLELTPLLGIILDDLKLVADYAGASIGVIEDDVFRFLESRGASAAQREAEMIDVRFPLARAPLIRKALHRHETIVIDDVRAGDPMARAYRAVVGDYLDAPAAPSVRSSLVVSSRRSSIAISSSTCSPSPATKRDRARPRERGDGHVGR